MAIYMWVETLCQNKWTAWNWRATETKYTKRSGMLRMPFLIIASTIVVCTHIRRCCFERTKKLKSRSHWIWHLATFLHSSSTAQVSSKFCFILSLFLPRRDHHFCLFLFWSFNIISMQLILLAIPRWFASHALQTNELHFAKHWCLTLKPSMRTLLASFMTPKNNRKNEQ